MVARKKPNRRREKVKSNLGDARRRSILDGKKTPQELVVGYQQYMEQVVTTFVKTHRLPISGIEEFISAGQLGLVEAASRYKGSGGVAFKDFAFMRIRGAIIDCIRRSSDTSGTSYRYVKAVQATQSLREELHDAWDRQQHSKALGTAPISDDLKAKTSEKAAKLADILDYAAQSVFAYRLNALDVDEEISIRSDQKNDAESIMSNYEQRRILRYSIKKLSKIERQIINGFYFKNKQFVELVDESKGLSKSWISRVHRRALERLRTIYEQVSGSTGIQALTQLEREES